MKTSLAACALLCIFYSTAQWGSDVNLSTSSSASAIPMNNARPLASDGSRLHLVYMDAVNGNPEIYYRKSTNEGLSWLPAVNLSTNLSFSSDPTVCFRLNYVYAFWIDNVGGVYNVYYSVSDDYGDNWSVATAIGQSTTNPSTPSTVVLSDRVYVAWNELNGVKLGNLYGTVWDPGAAHYSGASYGATALASNGTSILISVCAETASSNSNIVYRRSIDSGSSFSNAAPLPGQQNTGSTPDIAIEGSHVHLTWVDERDGTSQIYYQHSGDLGFTWDDPVPISIGTATNYFPSIAADGDLVVITWERDVSGNWEIYYANSSTAGLSWNVQERLTNANEGSERSCVDVSNTGKTHVVWIDSRDLNYEIYYNSASNLPASSGIGLTEKEGKEFTVQNPVAAGSAIEVFGSGLEGGLPITLTDLQGKSVALHVQYTSTGAQLLPATPMESGMYVLRVGNVTRKIVLY